MAASTAVAEDARIKVLVVDDSAFTRRSIGRMFEESREIRVIGYASDGAMALEKVRELRPDVVTLDVQMPVMDGLTALTRIMAEVPTPVIMLSCCTPKGGEQTIKALELGAVDFVDKTSAGGPMEIAALARELTEKIQIAARIRRPRPQRMVDRRLFRNTVRGGAREGAEVVLIGTSTGGPAALAAVLGGLPETFRRPILVVQHMPAGFTAPLAERLDRSCAIGVKEAENGEIVKGGCAYIAPAGQHLKLRRTAEGLVVELDTTLTAGELHCPSVDALFHSAAAVCEEGCLAFVLTGMGCDGAAGAAAIKKKGGRVFVEAEETSVVYGMPKAAAAAAETDGELPLFEVAQAMLRLA